MIIMSYNIRGGGSKIKRKRIDYLVRSGKADVCFIQGGHYCVEERPFHLAV